MKGAGICGSTAASGHATYAWTARGPRSKYLYTEILGETRRKEDDEMKRKDLRLRLY
jgi:hypothetical protein